MRPPDKHQGPDANPGPDITTPPPSRTAYGAIVADRGDPRRVGELLGDWLAIHMAEIDDLVAEARARVDAIPDQRALWLLAGELTVRLLVVEQDLAELRKAVRR